MYIGVDMDAPQFVDGVELVSGNGPGNKLGGAHYGS
jgi:hypothetical protein